MDKVTDFLVDWVILYIKNRDIILKNLEFIEKLNSEIKVKYKDKEQVFIIRPFITDLNLIIDRLKEAPHAYISLATFNSEDNFKKILEKWNFIKGFKFFSILFVNPFSQTDKKWIVYPYTHQRICDEDSLELGLRTMFESVEPITEGIVKAKIK